MRSCPPKVLAGGADGVLVAAADNLTALRASALLELLTAAGIVALTTLLFASLSEIDRPRALVAQGLWITEAGLLAVAGLGLYALAALGAQVSAGSATASLSGAATVAFSLYQYAFTAHMLFFCLGAPLWYSLLYRSSLVPHWLAGWGLIASLPLLVSTLLTLWDRSLGLGIIAGLPYAPFELFIGVWLIVHAGRTASAPAQLEGVLT